jgi:hypothetical protein
MIWVGIHVKGSNFNTRIGETIRVSLLWNDNQSILLYYDYVIILTANSHYDIQSFIVCVLKKKKCPIYLVLT